MPASVPPTFLRRNGTYRRGWSSWGKRQQLWCPYRRQTCKSGILPCTSLSNLLAGCSRVFLATIASSFENSSDGTLLNHRLDSLCADSWFAGSESDGSSYTIHGRPHHLPLPFSVWFIRSEMECLVWPDSPILDHGIADGILGRVYLSHNWFHCIPVEESETVMPALVSSSSPHVVFQVLWWNMCRLCTRLLVSLDLWTRIRKSTVLCWSILNFEKEVISFQCLAVCLDWEIWLTQSPLRRRSFVRFFLWEFNCIVIRYVFSYSLRQASIYFLLLTRR